MAPDFDRVFVSPMIFLEENGAPMEFYIKPGNMKDKILPIIERGGGMVSSKITSKDVIRLMDPKNPVKGFVSTEFIFDSIQKQYLQDINKYTYTAKAKQRSNERFVQVVNYQYSSSSEDRSKAVRKSYKNEKRKRYTFEEDTAILNYVKEHESCLMPVCGNKLWKKVARDKVTTHSWQSMRDHYLKFLRKRRSPLVAQTAAKKRKSPQASNSPIRKSKCSEPHTSRKKDSIDSDSDFDDQPYPQRAENRGQKKTIQESDKDADEQPSVQRAVTRGKQNAIDSDDTEDQPLAQRAMKRKQKKTNQESDDAEDQSLVQRAVTRGKQKAIDSGDTDVQPLARRAMTRRHKKGIIESDTNTNDQSEVQVGTTGKGKEKAIETSDTEDQPLNQRVMTRRNKKVIESDSNLDDSPVACQESTKGQNKERNSDGKLVTKRRMGTRKRNKDGTIVTRHTRASDIDSETDVTMSTDQGRGGELDSESETDEFDKRLLAIAERASFNASYQASRPIDDDDTDNETSAKDTQEDDDDEFIFKKKNRRKKSERMKVPGTSLQATQMDVIEQTTGRTTRSQSKADKTSSVRVTSKATTPSKNKTTTRSTQKDIERSELSQESWSRQLFSEDNEEQSTPTRSKGKTKINTESKVTIQTYDKMWQDVDKMLENYQKIEKLACSKGMKKAQLLHALHVSNGSLEDTEKFIKTGKLSNGAGPWSEHENKAILSNDKEAVNTIIKKRGRHGVSERGSFLRGCR